MYKIAIVALLLLTNAPVWAQNISDTSSKLKDIEEILTSEQTKEKTLEEQQKNVEKQLKTVTDQSSKTIQKIKATERDAVQVRGQINELKIQQAAYEQQASRTEAMIVPMLSNAMDIKSIPADLKLFLNSESDMQSQLTTHVALQSAARTIKTLLEDYQHAKEELSIVENTLEDKQVSLNKSLDSLGKERIKLEKQMDIQAALRNETSQYLKDKKKKVSDLQLKRESLSTLLDQLKREEIERKEAKARAKEEARTAKLNNDAPQIRTFKENSKKKKIASGLPAAGYIISNFGDTDPDSGVEAQGITIQGEPSGLVTAPKSGEVRYTGAFRSMGQMVLIEHKNGDFTLLAGLSKISVSEGGVVQKDTPIGTLSSSTNPLPQLYYELRRNGEKPVDPTGLF